MAFVVSRQEFTTKDTKGHKGKLGLYGFSGNQSRQLSRTHRRIESGDILGYEVIERFESGRVIGFDALLLVHNCLTRRLIAIFEKP